MFADSEILIILFGGLQIRHDGEALALSLYVSCGH